MKITKLKFETDFPIDFFLALNTCPWNKEERYRWAINFAEEWGLEVHNGMTRVAFVFDDFAIKLDINSSTNGCEEEYKRFQIAREYGIERILLTIENSIPRRAVLLFTFSPNVANWCTIMTPMNIQTLLIRQQELWSIKAIVSVKLGAISMKCLTKSRRWNGQVVVCNITVGNLCTV